jgi:uncharacterized protein (TIGR02757 family)
VTKDELQTVLDEAYLAFAKPNFQDADPIQIPHRFSKKEDIEIAGFIAATIAWGQRITIINNANRFIEMMDDAPFDFIVNHTPSDRNKYKGFVHRTFNEVDAMYFLERLQRLYKEGSGLEQAFNTGHDTKARISNFHNTFFDQTHPARTTKHVSNPKNGSSAKRLNMFLRWMVRPASEGVDFGVWKAISPSELMIPLDVHSGNVARKLRLLERKQNDWKAVEALTNNLKAFDSNDPVKYDLALFGMGVSGVI